MADVTGMQPSGRVLPLYKGDYDNDTVYEQTDVVLYNVSSYIALQDTIGNPPPKNGETRNEHWQLIAKGMADVSDSTVEFTQAETRSNIASGETGATLFGKIKKWFADLKPHCFNALTNNLLANVPGVSAMDAAVGPGIDSRITSNADAIAQLNSDFSKLQIDNFTELLTEFGINTSTVFNSMDELNLVIPKNTHTLCTINADATGKQLANVLPGGIKYGILEIIKGYNNSFCKFIYYSSTIAASGRIYVYDSRYSSSADGSIDSVQEWKEIAYMAANSAGGDVLTEFNFTLSLGDSIILKQTPNLKKYAKLAFVSGSTVNGNPSLVGLAYPWLLDRQTGWNVGTANSYYFAVTFGNKQNVYRLENNKLTWVSGDVVVRYIIGLYS